MSATSDSTLADPQQIIADLQRQLAEALAERDRAQWRLAERTAERDEALEQQTATAEVLQVINSSPGDLMPVFDAMLQKAVRLCDAPCGYFLRRQDNNYFLAAGRGLATDFETYLAHMDQPRPGEGNARALQGEPYIHLLDLKDDEPYRAGAPLRRASVDLGGLRTGLLVPLRKDGEVLGTFSLARQEVRPFTDKQIALVQNFAAQAVIAMENARLLTETREALEQQTATAEILGVINASPGDLAPVFDAMLEKAMRLCEAAFGTLLTYDGERFRPAAALGVPAAFAEFRKNDPPEFGPESGLARILLGLPFDHTLDAAADELYERGDPRRRALVELGGARTILAVPLRKDSAVLGVFTIYRQEVRPFTDKQIALLQNFAAQAVIAMENARLITETREALEQQTATAEVLQVINSSPGELTPVFDAMLEKAIRLCGGNQGALWTLDGEHAKLAASRGNAPEFFAMLRDHGRAEPSPPEAVQLTTRGAHLLHISDLIEHDLYRAGDPITKAAVDFGGVRSLVGVALVKDGAMVGAFMIGRREVRPFSDKQIALLQNFAAQAVIAIENARLINETREALEQQTATAEVLQVINSSRGDLAPVFDAMLEKAMRLCGAEFGEFLTTEGERLQAVAVRGVPTAFAEFRYSNPMPPTPGSITARVLAGEPVIHVADVKDDDHYRQGDPHRRALVDLGGARTFLSVTLLKDRAPLGSINIYRQEVRPFSDKQITLLQNFAAQAVIAMDNARLLDEIRQRQAELRVTFDNMGDGVAMFDGELRLAAWNMNFQRLLELPDAFLAKRPDYNAYVHYLADRGEFGSGEVGAELSRRLEHTDEELRFERTRPDGRVIEVRRNAVPGGGFVLIYGDITERKRAEAEIHAARDAAEKALSELKAAQASLIQAEKMASLGQLTAGIAHEIKNPLNFVNNFASLSTELLDELKEAAAPALAGLSVDQRGEIDETMDMLTGNLDKIAEHGRRADGIVKSMLEHSRGATGERRAVNLNDLVDEALNLAYHGARAQDQGFNITLERDFEPSLPPIEMAPQEMTRVFLNLFSNGFYAANKRRDQVGSPHFRPTLKVTTRHTGDTVEVHVRDNGVGISPEIRDKLFQPFFTTKPTGEGTGLGLSISYDIVTQQHGGTISVESEPGAFTEFTVRLPRH